MHDYLGFDFSKMKLGGAFIADVGLSRLVSSLKFSQSVAIILGLCGLLLVLRPKRVQVSGAPIYGYLSWLEPTILVQTRFATNARDMITAGCKKVEFVLCVSEEPKIADSSEVRGLAIYDPPLRHRHYDPTQKIPKRITFGLVFKTQYRNSIKWCTYSSLS